MPATATINVRLPQDLKDHGMQVLDKAGMSITDFVKKSFEYMEREQEIPQAIASEEEEDIYEKRRRILREVARTISVPKGYDPKADYHAYLDEKYREFIA